ncbi:zinc finger protein 626-like [Uranotaenia lowii]|uniref:zinc finger protein 626-like n=1 Tax=Uranotaenia lowii TaxID=190385 RepID=UPI0024784525|nr:zinc finger protein 626-like [Uranotaenia lowii]
MPCIVPTCSAKVPDRRLRTFPKHPVLVNRWLQALRVGCELQDVPRGMRSARVMKICDEHFEEAESDVISKRYLEPTRFRNSKGAISYVSSCHMCQQFFSLTNMLDCERIKRNVFRDRKHNFNFNTIDKVLSSDGKLSRFVCLSCTANIEIMHRAQLAIDSSFKSYKSLERKIDIVIEVQNSISQAKNAGNECPTINITSESENQDSDVEIIKDNQALELDIENITSNPPTVMLVEKCFICTVSFSTELQLRNHLIEQHGKTGTQQCEVCGESFLELIDYNTHLEMHPIGSTDQGISDNCRKSSNNVIPESTTINRKPTPRRPIINHFPPNSLIQCKICDKSYRLMSELDKHARENHEGDKPFACPTCDYRFKSSKSLRKHDSIVHHNVPRTNYPSGSVKCLICSIKFIKTCDLATHIQESHSGEEYPYLKCTDCMLTFDCKKKLNYHMLLHTGRYVCQICGKHCNGAGPLRVHLRDRHSDERGFECEFCKARFKTNTVLRLHVERKHKEERNFKCEICQKAFKTLYNLNSHKKIHFKEGNFSCEICQKVFPRKSYLKDHRKSHSEPEYQCDICKKKFRTKSSLEYHLSNKNPEVTKKKFECKLCNKFMTTKSNLIAHFKSHGHKSKKGKNNFRS